MSNPTAYSVEAKKPELVTFALAVLSILENDENWSGDTLMEIASAAENRELAQTDGDDQFRSTVILG